MPPDTRRRAGGRLRLPQRRSRLRGAHRRAGLRQKVPEEISVIGFDNSDTSRIIRPALSTIATDQKAIAEAALELIEAMIAGTTPGERQLVTSMVIRDTTK